MVNIYIKDSGRLQVPYTTETPFVDFDSATQAQKRAGEFKEPETVLLKGTQFTFGLNDNIQRVSGTGDLRSVSQKTGMQPIQFTITCTLDKPKTFRTIDPLDLPVLGYLLKQKMSNGYKQLWIEDASHPDRETLFSLYELIKLFGVEDASLTDGTTVGLEKKHVKIRLEGYTHNEGVENLTFQLGFTLLWDF